MLQPITFKPRASRALNGIALVFDLEGFSKFFNQPDVQDYVPSYLNHVFRAISCCINGGENFWVADDKRETLEPLKLPPPNQKFLGDGALYVWIQPKDKELDIASIRALANRLWNLKQAFGKVNKCCHDDVPVADLPPRIRFGLARGTIYELSGEKRGTVEHIGFCINLASRLQKYCPELGFIASARLGLEADLLNKHGYKKVIAKAIRGFPKEVVIVDKTEYDSLDVSVRNELFEEI